MTVKGFCKEDGYFVKALDEALCSFNVERQAYHGGSFIGNHIHRALKVSNGNFKILTMTTFFMFSLITPKLCAKAL